MIRPSHQPQCTPYEVLPRKDPRGVDLISDALPFGRLWYAEPNAASNAVDYAQFILLAWFGISVCARHTSIAETAARPSQGRRSRNVMTMVALS
jgi:hypothetical protein